MIEQLSNYQSTIDLLVKYTASYGLKVLMALLIFWIGKRLARWVTNLMVKAMRSKQVDVELVSFLESLLYWGLFALVCVAALGQLGIQTASFIAIMAAAGLAVGLALQGSLSNFAAGVLIIILRPFRVGEFVNIAGESGKVQSIKIFTTELRTPDNKCVIIPNARVLDSNIVNHSSTGTRRIDLTFGIGYQDDIDHAKAVLRELIERDERILQEPGAVIGISALADSSVNIVARPWVKSDDYWNVYMDLNEAVKKRFDQEGISIPFPQRTVHMRTE